MTFNSFAQLAEKYVAISKSPDNEADSTRDQEMKPQFMPTQNMVIPINENSNFGDIYAPFDPANELYD